MSEPVRCPERAALPQSVTIYEVGPRDGLQNEKGIVPVEAKAEFIQRLLAAGLPVVEATSFVHPKWVPQLADAGELMELLVDRLGETGEVPARARAQRARPRPRARARLRAHRDLRQRHRDLRPAQPQPQPRRAVRDVRAHGAPCARGRDGRAGLREHVLRRPVGGRRTDRPGGARPASASTTSAPASSRSATPSASARPATSASCSRRSTTRACRTTRSPCTSTTPTGRRSPTPSPRCSTASPPSTPVPAASAAARTPRAPPATSPPRTSSGCCTAWASRPGSTCAALVDTSGWMAGVLGRPSPSRVVTALTPGTMSA